MSDLRAVTRVLSRDICCNINENAIEEIRIRVDRPVILKYPEGREQILNHIITQNEILNILQSLCNNSIYSYQSQICDGYITLQGGHRVGITGNVAMKDGKITNVNYISSLNFRIAREIIGASDEILKEVITRKNNASSQNSYRNINNSIMYINGNSNNQSNNKNSNIENNDISNLEINNTLIVSKPGCGKTTVLRDLVRNISNMGFNVSLIDERGEIASMYKGIPQNDIGLRTDVLDNVTKSLGMKIAVRTMAPQVIVADEIGTEGDLEAINYGICSGVKGIFTAHGLDIAELRQNTVLNKLYEEKLFKRIIFLQNRGKMEKVYFLDRNMYKTVDGKMV